MTSRATSPASEQSEDLSAHWPLAVRLHTVSLFVVTVLAAPASPVLAQEAALPEPRLKLNTSISSGYDGNVFVESMGVADPRYRDGGAHIGAGMDLVYSR